MIDSYRTDETVAGSLSDFLKVFLPNTWTAGAGTPMVLCAFGSGDNAAGISVTQEFYTFAKAITDAGFGCALSLYGGNNLFGNTTARNQVGVIANHLQTDTDFGRPVVGAGKLVLASFSMGGSTLLNWAGNVGGGASSRVKAFVGACPLVNMAPFAGSLSSQYPSGLNYSTDDPTTMSAAGKYSGVKSTVCWSANDGVLNHSDMAGFVNNTVANEVPLGNVGHVWTNLLLPSVRDAIISAASS